MGENEVNLLGKIAGSTQSELILFFIVMIVGMAVFGVVFYRQMSKDRKYQQDKSMERDNRFLEVIKSNTEAMTGLKATLEANGTATVSSLSTIHDRISNQNAKLGELYTTGARIETTLERSISNQQEMSRNINKILLIVDSMPHTSAFHAESQKEKSHEL